jgi:glycosyltransferase involved in cell wall biosynthesis
VDDVAAVSGSGKKQWVQHTHVNPSKVRVIHNSTEIPSLEGLETTSREVREELGIPPDATVVGVSAALVPIKGHAYLLAAFAAALGALPNCVLVLAGDGPRRTDLEQQAHRLGIADRVWFLGHRTDIQRVVQAYDVVALASVTESLPFSLLEGMAYERPALATAVGGVPELVEDGVNGRLVPPRDVDALSEALIDLLGDMERLERMGKAARRRVQSEFNAGRMVRETMDMVLGTAS